MKAFSCRRNAFGRDGGASVREYFEDANEVLDFLLSRISPYKYSPLCLIITEIDCDSIIPPDIYRYKSCI